MLAFRCVHCQKKLLGPPGRKVLCPRCRQRMVVPKPARPRRWLAVGAGVAAASFLVFSALFAWFLPRTPSSTVVAPPELPAQPPKPVAQAPIAHPPRQISNPATPETPQGPEKPRPKAPTVEDARAEALARINLARKAAGMDELKFSEILSQGCQQHADYVVQNQLAQQPDDWLEQRRDRPGFSEAGQVAAKMSMMANQPPDAAVARWLAHVGPRCALLNPELQKLGLGTAKTPKGEWFTALDLQRGRDEPVVVYPGPGQADVYPLMTDSSEVPEAKTPGFPITVGFPVSAVVTGAQSKLRDAAGKDVDHWLFSPEKPLNPRSQRKMLVVVPKAPLPGKTAFQVEFAARVDGRPWQRSWQFTTEDDTDRDGRWAQQAVDHLNALRAGAGLPPVGLNPELSASCLAHVQYLARNVGHPALAGLGAHDEDPKLPGYSEQGRQAGLASNLTLGDLLPTNSIDAWMATLYHRVPLLNPQLKTVGFACVRTRKLGWVVALDVKSGVARQPRAEIIVYPVPDQRDVPLHFPSDGEEPNPIPGDADGRAGYPITATFPLKPGKAAARLTDDQDREVACWLSSPDKPANPKFAGHQGTTVCLIPHDPLRPDATYHASFEVEHAGKLWKRAWSFRTQGPGLAPADAQRQVLAAINVQRRRAGAPGVVFDAALTHGCQAHAEYLARNVDALARQKSSVNDEEPTLPGFTPHGRLAARQSDVFINASAPQAQIDYLLATATRRAYLLDPTLRSIGFGCAREPGRGWRCVLDLNGGRGDPRVFTYPADGQTEVPTAGFDAPRAKAAAAGGSDAGFPITLHLPRTASIRRVQATLADADGKDLDFDLSTPEQPLLPQVPGNVVALLPRAPLPPGRTIRVSASVVLSGTEWRQSWSFTTSSETPARGR